MQWLEKLNKEDYCLKGKDYILYVMLLFLIGGFVGFIVEELYFLLDDGILVKRGFLYGPFIPIYSWGILIIVFFLVRYKKKPVIIFTLSMILSGILEGLTGYFMFLIWHKRWWDYTGLFLDIGGYVCLKSLLQFGFGGLIVIYFLEPLVKKIMNTFNKRILYILSYSAIFIYVVDSVLSFLIKHKL